MNYLVIQNLVWMANEIPSLLHYPPIKAGAHEGLPAIFILLFCFPLFWILRPREAALNWEKLHSMNCEVHGPSSPRGGLLSDFCSFVLSIQVSRFPSHQFFKRKPGSKDALNSLQHTKARWVCLGIHANSLICLLHTLNKVKTTRKTKKSEKSTLKSRLQIENFTSYLFFVLSFEEMNSTTEHKIYLDSSFIRFRQISVMHPLLREGYARDIYLVLQQIHYSLHMHVCTETFVSSALFLLGECWRSVL